MTCCDISTICVDRINPSQRWKALMKRFRWALPFAVLLVLCGIAWILLSRGVFDRGGSNQSPTAGPIPSQYDSERAFGYLKQLCDLGPRPSGSPAMMRAFCVHSSQPKPFEKRCTSSPRAKTSRVFASVRSESISETLNVLF